MQLKSIAEIAALLGLGTSDVEPYGWHKGKLALGLEQRFASRPLGKYVAVTAVSPTPFGEGKTVVAIGLAMALNRLGSRAVCTLREPSLAPVFGIKGGGAGGGRCSLQPADDINLHFTGDLHAVTSANNLLAAMTDNHVKRRLAPPIDPGSVTWRRVLDLSDKGLSQIVTGLGALSQAPLRETGFDLTAASEVMAILALADGTADLRTRLGKIVVGHDNGGSAVTADDIGAAGAMAALLRDAIRPNLVQTCEGTPAIVHTGPFANIAHGNSSVIADRIALRLADYVVTESGFGADCGAEKFFHIKCRSSGLMPDAVVLVCTVRALKHQSGRFQVHPGKSLPEDLLTEDLNAVAAGSVNLQAHLEILRRFGVRPVVAINRFPTDTGAELKFVAGLAAQRGAQAAIVTDCFERGSEGASQLAEAVQTACLEPATPRLLYPLDASLAHKFTTVAKEVYGAQDVEFTPTASRSLREFESHGFGRLPICIAKTQYSLSHDPAQLGRPTGFTLPIKDVHLASGAGFVYGLAGDIVTMPGLPTHPAARHIDVAADGRITGLT
jgi:formate--tetrahydrofolate ligase